MVPLLTLTKVEQLTLRAEATKVLAHLVNVFSKSDDQFYKTKAIPISEIVYKSMIEIDDYEIREVGFQYFYCLADSIGNKFDPLFDKLFPLAIKWAEDQSEIIFQRK